MISKEVGEITFRVNSGLSSKVNEYWVSSICVNSCAVEIIPILKVVA
jgi:hypothetical protein